MAKKFLYEEHVEEISQLADELPDIIDYDEWSAREYGSKDVDYERTAFNLIKAGYKKAKNTRLYNYALKHIEELADEQLSPWAIPDGNKYIHIWLTTDGMEFMNYQEALDHQIEYLLEEDDEE